MTDDRTRLKNHERVEQSKREIDRLVAEVERWLARRRKADEKLQQYNTQLNTIEALLKQASMRLREQVDATPRDLTSGLVYAACRLHDLRTAWLRGVWTYYQVRFDQRDHEDEKLRRVLAAADEVVWSCYAEAFKNAALARPDIRRGSAPLPYFESRFSPEAIPRDDPPRDLGSNVDASFLGDFLKTLPVPLVILPPYCYDAPWWLIYVAHEIGHHVQFDLLPERGALDAYKDVINGALAVPPGAAVNPTTAARWSNWNEEIFADAFSVAAVGGAAIWAMGELEAQGEVGMVTPKVRYPAPAVRLQLLAEMGAIVDPAGAGPKLDVDPSAFTSGAPIMKDGEDLRKQAGRDLELTAGVAKAALQQTVGGVTTVEKLAGWQPGQVGTTALWRKVLLGQQPRVVNAGLQTPRLVAAAGVDAWRRILDEADETRREDARARLAELLPAVIIENREPGTRAAVETAAPIVEGLGDGLAERLLQAGVEELGS